MRPTAPLLRLYPARWRARFGDEFAALLEERPLGPFDVADILLGALDAHLHLRGLGAASQHAKGFAMSLRIGGYAAIAGGALLFSSLGAGQLLGEGAIGFALVGVFVATLAVLVALVGLSASRPGSSRVSCGRRTSSRRSAPASRSWAWSGWRPMATCGSSETHRRGWSGRSASSR